MFQSSRSKEIVLRELRERLTTINIDGQVVVQDGIVLNEAAVKVLGTDLAFIESDRMQRCLSEAWMEETVFDIGGCNRFDDLLHPRFRQAPLHSARFDKG